MYVNTVLQIHIQDLIPRCGHKHQISAEYCQNSFSHLESEFDIVAENNGEYIFYEADKANLILFDLADMFRCFFIVAQRGR